MRKKIGVKGEIIVEEMCAERGCACYDDRVDKGVEMYGEDTIAMLEQENRQLRARNERLEKESTCLSVEQVSAMWRHCDGKPLVFARMVESFHGIGELVNATS